MDDVANALALYRALHPRSKVQGLLGVKLRQIVCRLCSACHDSYDDAENHKAPCARAYLDTHTDHGLLTVAEAIETLEAER